MRPARLSATHPARLGYTLLEVMVVLTIMGIMLTLPARMCFRAVEQSKLDVAAGNLRAIWGAQRFYYLEHGEFGELDQLAAEKVALIEPMLAAVPSKTFYAYVLEWPVVEDGRQSFLVKATHPGTPRCNGWIAIDQDGTLVRSVFYAGEVDDAGEPTPMIPSMERTP